MLAGASYLGVMVPWTPLGLRILFAFSLVVACVATATSVMHDANHGAFSRSKRVNLVFGYSSDLLGASSLLWRFKHNHLHHGNTNVFGFDNDIDQSPFARLVPEQPWRPWHRYQHIYMWVLYGFLTIQWFVAADIANMIRGKVSDHRLNKPLRARDVAMVMLGKVLHAAWALVIPMIWYPWWAVLAFYLAGSWLVGFMLANIFQLAHCVDRSEFFGPEARRRGGDFERHQLRVCVNVQSPTPLVRSSMRWLMGGLDYQIEHHLAPKLPHTVYPLIAPRLAAACAADGLKYRTHPSLHSAIGSHARWLRTMGRKPTPNRTRP